MRITVLCVGKIKEKYFVQGIEEYAKRLSRYCKLEIVEVPDEKTPDGASDAIELQIKRKEGDKLLSKIKDGSYVVALAINGKQYDSVEFGERIQKLGVMGESHIVFVIGGSLGLDERVLALAKEKISFSKMTFPHQMMRMVLLEQVYRGFRIVNGEPYHK